MNIENRKSFGEVLKEVRLKNGDSMKSLSEKLGIFYTYVDKIEKNVRPINKNIFEKLLKAYSSDKKKLITAYTLEVFPENSISFLSSSIFDLISFSSFIYHLHFTTFEVINSYHFSLFISLSIN